MRAYTKTRPIMTESLILSVFLSVIATDAQGTSKSTTLTAASILWNTDEAEAPTLTITLPNSTELDAGKFVYVELTDKVKDDAAKPNAIAATGIAVEIKAAADMGATDAGTKVADGSKKIFY